MILQLHNRVKALSMLIGQTLPQIVDQLHDILPHFIIQLFHNARHDCINQFFFFFFFNNSRSKGWMELPYQHCATVIGKKYNS
jgi:hypothetical protein